jgi:hypothetical protein
MFDIPQPSIEISPNLDGREHLSVTEDSGTMRLLLSGIYPCLPDPLDDIKDMDLDRLVHLLQVSMKYILELVTSRLTEALSVRASAIRRETFTIYAIARVLNLRNLAEEAASSCLRCGFTDMIVMYLEELPMEVNLEGPSERLSEKSVGSEAIRTECLAHDPETSSRLAESISFHSILSQFSGREYQRLLQFYRLRISKVKEIINEAFTSIFHYNCTSRGSCKESIRSSLKSLLISEAYNRGPALERILSDHFATSVIPSSACGNCWQSTIIGECMDRLRKIKNDVDALPSFQP